MQTDVYLGKLHTMVFGPDDGELAGRAYEDIIKDLHARDYSDLRADGFQYVDLVMEGGGLLGIALLGYTYVLEQCGVRFWSIAGTSAGAITAGLLAGIGRRDESRSGKVLEHLAALNPQIFLDGDERTATFLEVIQNGDLSFKTARKALMAGPWEAVGNWGDGIQWSDFIAEEWKSVWEKLGVNPGDAFTAWVSGILAEAGVRTNRDLTARLSYIPPSILAQNPETKPGRLAIIAADITTQTKVSFPADAPLYWRDSDGVSPAAFVRASMAVPLFFEPLRVTNLPAVESHRERWEDRGYTGPTPDEILLVDGGIVSNFPISVFHSSRPPRCPTFGVKLGRDGTDAVKVRTPHALLVACFEQARHSMDREFLANNLDYRHLVSYIDTGEHRWLDFQMSDEEKSDLFARGAREALRFLRKFDWPAYKQVRANILEATRASQGATTLMTVTAPRPGL